MTIEERLKREVAICAAPFLNYKEDDLRNLIIIAIAWGWKAHDNGYTFEGAIREGCKL